MQTHAPSTARLLRLIAFALTSLVLAIIVYISFHGSTPLRPVGYEFSLRLPDSGNLVPGSDVEIAGVKIGSVEQVQRAGGDAQVTVEIDPQYAPVRSDARAIMRTKTLLGEAYIELSPGTQGAPAIRDGGQLPPSHVLPTVSLDQFLQAFNPSALHNFRAFFSGFASALHGRAGDLNGSLARGAPFSADITGVMQTLSGESSQLQTLFGSAGQMMQALGARVGDLQGAVRAGDEVLTDTADRSRDLEALFRALPPFLTQVRATSDVITAQSGEFNRAMAALVPAGELLAPTLRTVRLDAPPIRQLFERLPTAITAAQRGCPARRAILLAIPSAFDYLYPAARQLIPTIQLLAAYGEEGLVGPMANASSTWNGTEVGPGGRIIARVGGALYASNESIAGYEHRLPTNRANPYFTPDGTAELAKIGALKSYDCRNVHNPEAVPPLGSGVPPCLTQGPWDYNGTTAYYPRLQPAGP